jgi:hypothetical protein
MKAIKLFAVIAILIFSFSAQALCPQQETTVVFINGVWTTKEGAIDHKNSLAAKAYASGINPDCVHFAYSHTQDDGHAQDVAESIIQKSTEFSVNISELVRMFLRLITPDATFGDLIDGVYARNVGEVNSPQLEKHLQRFRELSLNKGHRGIAITHSQGGLYGNALWNRLTSGEQENTRLITVATPAQDVADGGPNTRLARDGVANVFFANALAEGTIPNTGLCDKETTAEQNSWLCHGFDTGYLHDIGAREQIIADITAALPTPAQTTTMQGYTYRLLFDGSATVTEGGVSVQLRDYDLGGILTSTVSSASGFYSMTVPVCAHCSLDASKFIPSDGITYTGSLEDFEIIPGPIYHLDVTMFPPPVSN